MTEREAIQDLAQMMDDLTSAIIGTYYDEGVDEATIESSPTIQMFREWQNRCQRIIREMGGVEKARSRVPAPRVAAVGVQA